MRLFGFGLRQAEAEARSGGHVSCQADYLTSVGVGRSDSRHEADSPFYTITKVSGILDVAVKMMGINYGVNKAHHHNPVLKASEEHTGDQVM